MKPLRWLGDSLKVVRGFSAEERQVIGGELRRVQAGLDPLDWKPMSTIGLGVREIRVHGVRSLRVIYVARFANTINVLHAFEKTSRKTEQRDIDLANARYRVLANEIRELARD